MKNVFIAFVLLLSWASASSQINPALLQKSTYTPQVSQVRLLGLTKPLRSTPPLTNSHSSKKLKQAKEIFNEREHNPTLNSNALPRGIDPLLNRNPVRNAADIDSIFTIEGLYSSGIYPPDPCGDIGRNEYIQMVNGSGGTLFQIFDKQGASIYGPAVCNTFWTQFGTTGLGDPIVMYDEAADRWMISELSVSFSDVLIAISETNDPLGSYYVYDFQTPGLPDYPKYFIWNDGYYFCSNEGSGGSPIYALNRADMLSGVQSTQLLRWSVPGFSAIGFQLASGADWDGAIPPPIGSPAYVLRIYDDAWGGGSDHLEVWDLQVDWNNPGNSTLNGPTDLAVSPFDSEVCQGFGYCVSQPSAGNIDVLQQILMHRVQYRNFGSYESMLCNHVVDVDGTGNTSGVRWYELRKSGASPWSIYQEGTVSPDADYRFMGSIAQDASGNIALGYSVSSSTTNPSLRILARNAGDPPGQMTFNELEIASGLGSFSGGRWGDYSAMSVDPVENSTFWFTGEYMGNSDWATKIVKFVLAKDSNDLAAIQLISPVTAGGLGSAETVKLRVKNIGIMAQSNFQVHYRIDQGAIVTETVGATLLPDSSMDYSFSTLADLSIVGQSYNFQLYTSLANDANRTNDTILSEVTHLVDLDINLLSLMGISGLSCGNSRDIGFVITNDGASPLSSCNVNYSLNGGTAVSSTISIALSPGQSDTIIVSVNGLINGNNTLLCFVSNPNGQADQNTSNDTLQGNFTNINPAINVTLELKTDDFPEETSWDLYDSNGNLLESGGSYTQSQTIITHEFCLSDSCFTFVIRDSYGDGMNFGTPGYFKLIRSDGVILATNTLADFGYSESHLFCSGFQCSVTGTASVVDATAIGANDGSILVSVGGGSSPFEYSLNGGTFLASNFFNFLLPGTYTVVVRDVNHCADTLIVTVGVSVGMDQLQAGSVNILVQPNPVEEVLHLEIENITGPAFLEIQISDITGKVVKHGTIPKYGSKYTGSIVFAEQAKGVYFIRIVNVNHRKLIRFIKS